MLKVAYRVSGDERIATLAWDAVPPEAMGMLYVAPMGGMYIDGGDLDETPADWAAHLREHYRRRVAAARAAMARAADERQVLAD